MNHFNINLKPNYLSNNLYQERYVQFNAGFIPFVTLL